MIIGFTGKQRVGKTTGAHFLVKQGFKPYSFAEGVKNLAYERGWNGKKDEQGRKLLQNLGTKKREEDPDYWIKQIKLEHKDVVFDDVRFTNEADWIKSKGGKIIRIVRDTGIIDNHISETEMDNYEVNATIYNHAMSLDDFKDFVLDVFKQLCQKAIR